jgi:hypothetical protein
MVACRAAVVLWFPFIFSVDRIQETWRRDEDLQLSQRYFYTFLSVACEMFSATQKQFCFIRKKLFY